eukprot:1475704-Amphidinium_carterae.1
MDFSFVLHVTLLLAGKQGTTRMVQTLIGRDYKWDVYTGILGNKRKSYSPTNNYYSNNSKNNKNCN